MSTIEENKAKLLKARSYYQAGALETQEGQSRIDTRNALSPSREEVKISAQEVARAVLASLTEVQTGLGKLSELFGENYAISAKMVAGGEQAHDFFIMAESQARAANDLVAEVTKEQKEYTRPPLDNSRLAIEAADASSRYDEKVQGFNGGSQQNTTNMQQTVAEIAEALTKIANRIPSHGQRGEITDREKDTITQYAENQHDTASDFTQAMDAVDRQIESL